jgi:hypothetical protein
VSCWEIRDARFHSEVSFPALARAQPRLACGAAANVTDA